MRRQSPTDLALAPTRTGDLLSRSADRSSVFSFALFLAACDFPPDPATIPPEQWQAALGRRLLTPQEQVARERYFERKTSEALAKLRPDR